MFSIPLRGSQLQCLGCRHLSLSKKMLAQVDRKNSAKGCFALQIEEE